MTPIDAIEIDHVTKTYLTRQDERHALGPITLHVAPGERYSVLVQMDKPGTWVWHYHILPHVENEERMFGMVTAVIVE